MCTQKWFTGDILQSLDGGHMNLRQSYILSGVLFFFTATLLLAASHSASVPAAEEAKARALANYGKLPLSFEENRGQADSRVKFLSQGNGYSILLTPSAILLNMRTSGRPGQAAKQSVVRMSFSGAQSSAAITGSERQSGISSYFVGNDPSKWLRGVPNYARVQYRGIYPGVDLILYGNHSQLEYDFVVAPGADARAIQLAFDGIDGMSIDRAGNLVVSTAAGVMRQHKPIVYQEIGGVRHAIDGRYVIQPDRRVSFQVARYDTRKPLVIDPVLTFATYLGGPGEELFGLSAAATQSSYPAVAVDSQGNVYLTGYNGGTATNFPGPPTQLGAGYHVFVAKINPTGTALLYSVVFGGGLTDVGGAIAVDGSGNAYVTGYTMSSNFPVVPSGAAQGTLHGPTNAFVAKVNAAGTALTYSTYLGGTGNDYGRAIALDRSGNAYVTGAAEESAGTNFPVTNASSPTPGFLTEVNTTGTAFVYSTFLGGGAGIGYGVALDSSGNAYVAGTTGTVTAPSPARAYVLKANTSGSISYGPVFLGNTGASLQTIAFAIALDGQNDAYVTGMTNDPNFPGIAGGGGAQHTYGGGLSDAFAMKLGPTGSVLYGTYIGGLGSNVLPERGSGIGVDVNGYAYVAGTTQCIGFPAINTIPGARNGGPAVLMRGSLSGSNSTWASLSLAGSFDQVTALAFDSVGNIYAGATAVSATGGGVYKSTDNGSTWSPLGNLSATSIDAIAVDPNSPTTLYAIGGGHIYRSTNSGGTWTAVGPAVGVSGSLAIAPTSPSTVYAGSSTGLLYSTNGTAWNTTTVPAPTNTVVNGKQIGVVVAVDPTNHNTAYAGTSYNGTTNLAIYKTTNAGAAWSAIHNPAFPNDSVTSLALTTTGTVYAATGSGLFYTSNGGTSWTQAALPADAPGTPYLVAIDASTNVYLAFQGAGIAVGTNGGILSSDWSALTYNGLTQNQIMALAVSPSSNTPYAGIVSATDAFLTRISPGGTSFSSSTCIGGADNDLGQDVAVTPAGTVYISGATVSTNFPVTTGALQRTLAGLYDDFVVSVSTTASNGPPSLTIDAPKAGAVVSGTITVSGWAIDNTSFIGTAIQSVHVYVDGAFAGTATYGVARQDVCNVFPGRPGCPNVGFTFPLNTGTFTPGAHTIIVYASDSDVPDPDVGSASVTITVAAVAPGPPSVLIDLPKAGTILTGTTTVSGWAIDNTSAVGTLINASSLQVKVDGNPVGTATYGVARQDVCNSYPGRAGCPNVGFTFSFNSSTLPPGTHTITVSATDTDAAPDTGSASVSVTVPGGPLPGPPLVNIDSIKNGAVLTGTATVSGWAIDNGSGIGTAISSVQIQVDGRVVGNATYGVARQDVCNNYPGRAGCPNVGFTYQLATYYLSAGAHTITAVAADSDGPPDTGSFSVSVTVNPTVTPTVLIDAPSPGATYLAGNLTISGWAIDNIAMVGTAINPGSLQVKVDGNFVGNATYGVPRQDVCNSYPGRPGCPNVGFTFSLNTASLAAGSHTITVSATDTDGTPDTGSGGVSINTVSTTSPPTVLIDLPKTGTVLSGTATVSGWAIDNSGVIGTLISTVQVKVDGTLVGNATYGVPRQDVCNNYPSRPGCPNVGFTYSLNTAVFSAGSHIITVSATDTDGVPDVGSASVTVTFSGGPPSLTIDTPKNGTTISAGPVTVSGWAIDNASTVGTAINAASLQVKVDGVVVGNATYGVARQDVCNVFPGRPGCPNVGFTFSTTLAPGSHTITVSATDTDTPTPDTGSVSTTVNAQ
jgi:Beta-propeller repeat/Bacterial Ig domain